MQPKQIHPWFRNVFLLGCLLSFIAGLQLFFLSEQTETYFAWTIQSRLTAATLGGFYFGSMTFGLLSAREKLWARVRGPALGLLVFTSVSLAATLLHLDKFHLDSQNWLTLTATRSWLAIYILLPPALALSMIVQGRLPGADLDRTTGFPTWFRFILTLRGVAVILTALALFFVPQAILPFWPWSLTPLTARALSAWLVSFGALDLHALLENDWQRVKVMSVSFIVSALFAFIALIRYSDEANLLGLGGLLYVVYLLSMLGFGIYGWRKAGLDERKTK